MSVGRELSLANEVAEGWFEDTQLQRQSPGGDGAVSPRKGLQHVVLGQHLQYRLTPMRQKR